jgi:integrase
MGAGAKPRGVLNVQKALGALPANPRGGSGRPKVSGSPAAVNEAMRMLRILASHAVDLGWLQTNPARDVPELHTGDGYTMWTTDQYRRFVACDAVPVFVRRAVVLLWWTGMRRGDACRLRQGAYDRTAGTLSYAAQKTRRQPPQPITVPVSAELRRWLARSPATDHDRLLSTETGRPMEPTYLGRCIRKALPVAGLPTGLSAHGLRLGIVSALAEAGAPDAAIEGLVPHSSRMTRHYRRQAGQALLARRALEYLEPKADKSRADKRLINRGLTR